MCIVAYATRHVRITLQKLMLSIVNHGGTTYCWNNDRVIFEDAKVESGDT